MLKRRGQVHTSRKIIWSFHNSRQIKLVFHVSQKRHFLKWTNVTYYIWKATPNAQPCYNRCLYHLSSFYSACNKKKSEQEHKERLSCHDHAILLITVENNRRKPESQFTTNYIFLSQFMENVFGKSQFRASNEITIHKKKKNNKQFHISREKK